MGGGHRLRAGPERRRRTGPDRDALRGRSSIPRRLRPDAGCRRRPVVGRAGARAAPRDPGPDRGRGGGHVRGCATSHRSLPTRQQRRTLSSRRTTRATESSIGGLRSNRSSGVEVMSVLPRSVVNRWCSTRRRALAVADDLGPGDAARAAVDRVQVGVHSTSRDPHDPTRHTSRPRGGCASSHGWVPRCLRHRSIGDRTRRRRRLVGHDGQPPCAGARRSSDSDAEEPPIERPSASTRTPLGDRRGHRRRLALDAALPRARRDPTDSPIETTRSLSALLVLGYLVSIASFAWWSHAQRLTIDALRWRSFRRPTRTWRWAVGWTATPVVAVALGVGVSFATPNRFWLVGLGAVLVAVRMMLLQALGTNMSRVVRGAKRWLPLWGLVTGIVDVVIVDIAITGVFDTRVEPGRLDDLVAWLLPAARDARAVRVLVHEARRAVGARVVGSSLRAQRRRGARGAADDPARVGRTGRLLRASPRSRPSRSGSPSFASYLAVAGTALWNGVNVWASRDQLSLASDVDAAIDRIGASAVAFVAAVCRRPDRSGSLEHGRGVERTTLHHRGTECHRDARPVPGRSRDARLRRAGHRRSGRPSSRSSGSRCC